MNPCQTCVKVLNFQSLLEIGESRWTEFFGLDFSPRGSWWSLYELPVEEWTADHQWRIVHGAIVTNRHRVCIDPGVGDECLFETLTHLFVECPRLESFVLTFKNVVSRTWGDFLI